MSGGVENENDLQRRHSKRSPGIRFLPIAFALGGVLGWIATGPASAQVTLDGTLGTAGALAGPAYTIPASAGQQRGANLFHSFGLFNVNTGESATFTGPASVANVISRVTGGQSSNIDGAIRSEIAGANLFFVNPAGIVFGPNAVLEVSGSFHAGTADYLRLGTDGRFDAKTPSDSVLTSVPPSAFGFLGPTPASITINASLLEVPAGKSISLIGGNITLTDATVRAPGGRINAVSLASAGNVRIEDSPANIAVTSENGLGDLRMDDGQLNSRGDGGGTVIIRAGRFFMANTALVSTSATGPTDGTILATAGEGIDIEVEDLTMDTGSEISSNVFASVAHAAPALRIEAERIEIKNNSVINTVAMTGSIGPSSGMRIEADDIDIHHGAFVRSNTGGAGTSGDLEVVAGELKVRDGGALFTMAFDGTGSAGDLVIDAGNILMTSDNSSLITTIGTYTYTTLGNSGDIRITADRISLSPATEITSLSTGPRDAGDVAITARELSITGMPSRFTGIVANTRQNGNAGTVSIQADNLVMNSFGSIQSVSSRNGRGGTLRLSGTNLHFTDNAYLYTVANGNGDAGSVLITGDSVVFDQGAGAYAYSLGPASRGGNIEIAARNVSIVGYDSALYPLGSDFTGLNAATLNGPGGSIRIEATEKALFANRAQLTSSSFGAGQAGTIEIDAGSMEVLSGAQLLSSASGSGPGGVITIAADQIRLSGVHPQRFSTGGPEMLAISAIASQTLGSAAAGRVEISAGSLEVLDGARISTQTYGSGIGGSIRIDADSVWVSGWNPLATDLLLSQGYDPRIAQWSGSSLVTADASSTGPAVTGRAGDVRIDAAETAVSERGRIMSGTMGSGAGGRVTLNGQRIVLSSGGEIAARSTGTGSAGNIEISASERFESYAGAVSTESDLAGGGSIVFDVGELFYLLDSAVTTSVRGGGGDAGNITIDPRFVVLNDSQIVANAYGGAGGNIRIVAEHFFASTDSRVEASSELGIDGTVQIDAPQNEIGQGLENLNADFLDAASLLPRQCGTGARGSAGSFTLAGTGTMPSDPDMPLTGSYAALLADDTQPVSGLRSTITR